MGDIFGSSFASVFLNWILLVTQPRTGDRRCHLTSASFRHLLSRLFSVGLSHLRARAAYSPGFWRLSNRFPTCFFYGCDFSCVGVFGPFQIEYLCAVEGISTKGTTPHADSRCGERAQLYQRVELRRHPRKLVIFHLSPWFAFTSSLGKEGPPIRTTLGLIRLNMLTGEQVSQRFRIPHHRQVPHHSNMSCFTIYSRYDIRGKGWGGGGEDILLRSWFEIWLTE